MDKDQENFVRLESSRSIGGFFLFIIPIMIMFAALGIVLFSRAANGGHDFWLSLGLCLLCMIFIMLFIWITILEIRRIRDPDVLELSTDGFHYFNLSGSKDVAAPWSQVAAPLKRTSGRFSYLQVDVAGQPLSLASVFGNLPIEAMIGIINSAREGRIVSPDEWLAEHPEPDETKAAIIGIGVGLVAAALIGSIIVLTAHH